MDMHLQSPPPRSELTAEAPGLAAALAEAEEPPIVLPDGPLLFAGTRSGASATLTLVGDVQGDALGVLPSEADVPGFRDLLVAERVQIGSEWVLFSQGTRVGRMTVAEVGLSEAFCTPRTTVTGPVELIPAAASVTRLMALPAETARSREYAFNPPLRHNYDQRVASLALANDAINRVGATRPADGALSIRQDIRAFQIAGESAPRIAATFVFRDRIDTSAPAEGAYSVFVMGQAAGGTSYRSTFVGYHPVATDGKAVARYFDHLDWDGDGRTEFLLDVFGEDGRWFSSLAERSGSWVSTSLDRCGGAASGGE